VVPAAATLSTTSNWSEEFAFSEIEDLIEPEAMPLNLWAAAQGFWYAVQ